MSVFYTFLMLLIFSRIVEYEFHSFSFFSYRNSDLRFIVYV